MTKELPFLVQGDIGFSANGEVAESFGPSSGTVDAAGNITLDKPAPEGMKEAAYFLPANALHDGSAGGWYRVTFSGPTTGTVHELVKAQ